MDPSRRHWPMILDTDIGNDPDDALALAIAARLVPELVLVTTTDETPDSRRARFARRLLDALGRSDVQVVAGPQLRPQPRTCLNGIELPTLDVTATDVVDAVSEVCARLDSPVRWVGLGPLTNVTDVEVLAARIADRLWVTQMGGALQYRDAERAEHNFRLDVPSASTAISLTSHLELVVSDVTFKPEMNLGPDSDVVRRLGESTENWAQLLTAHLQCWFDATAYEPPGTMQHDPLTLSVALGMPFVRFTSAEVALDGRGRLQLHDEGWPLLLASSVDYEAFRAWLAESLDPVPRP